MEIKVYNFTMSSRASIIILIQVLFAFNNLNAQCCYTKNQKVINDSCKKYVIKTDFEKGLEFIPKMGILYSLVIENGDIPIFINDSLHKHPIYNIFVGKVINDTVFSNFNYVVNLYYECDTFNSNCLNLPSIAHLTVFDVKKDVKINVKDTNYKLMRLAIVGEKEFYLDTSLFLLKKLINLSGTYNPFQETNLQILEKLERVGHLGIWNMDFRNFDLNIDLLMRIRTKSIYFSNCKFKWKQRKLVRSFSNFSIIH